MKHNEKPRLVIIAGPNGAGKSTLTSEVNPKLIEDTVFINPDEIAKEMVLLYPEKTNAQHQVMAGREALKAYDSCFEKKQSLSLETTLAGNSSIKTILNLKTFNKTIHDL
jgi:predicted ABC-type ATPase